MKQIVVTLNGIKEEEAFYLFLQGWIDPAVAEKLSLSTIVVARMRREIYQGLKVFNPAKQQKRS